MSEEVKEAPDGVLEQGEFKIKKKPKKLVKDEPITKLDLSKPKETLVEEKEEETTKVEIKNEEKEEVQDTESIIQEVVEETETKIEEKQEKIKPTEIANDMPEGVDKLIEFMKETGGTIEDYTRLNTDYSTIDENVLLNEYYKNTKPHLDQEERNFLIKDNFSYDEEIDDERVIRKKKLAYKEEIAKAKNFLEETKSKY